MPLLILQITGSALYVSVMALLGTVPFFLFQLPFGALLDRWNRRTAMLVAGIGRGLLILAVPVVWLGHGPILPTLFAITVPLSILSSLFGAGSSTMLSKLVSRDDLNKACALFEAAESGAWVAGPVLAAATGAWFELANALIVDGLSFFASALGLTLIAVPKSAAARSAQTVWVRIADGLRFLATTTSLRRIQIYWSLYGIIGYGAVTGLIYAGSHGGTSDPALASFAVSAYALGSVAGTLFAGRPGLAMLNHAIAFSLLAFAGGALLVTSALKAGIFSGAFLIGAGEGFFLVFYLARRALATPDDYLARIGTTAAVLARIASGISIAWVGAALDLWQGPGAFGAMAVLALLLSGFIFLVGEGTESSRQPVR
jgi:MFS family permease